VEPESWIWVDALCINQDDDEEKAVQVQKMDRIFSFAQQVVIWLGKPTPHTRLAFEYFKYAHAEWRLDLIEKDLDTHKATPEETGCEQQLVQERESLRRISRRSQTILDVRYDLSVKQLNAVRSFVDELLLKHLVTMLPLNAEDIEDTLQEASYRIYIPPVRHPFWDSMFSLLSHEWFRRVRTYQEMYLAKFAVVLHEHGTIVFPLVYHLREKLFSRMAIQEFWSSTLHSGQDKLSTARLFCYRWATPLHQHLNLHHFLMNLRNRQGTIGKDYIYCLLGMLDDNTRAAIPVDYALPDAVVLMNAVKLAVSQYPKSLAILWEWYGHTDSVLEGLQSWCPDFTNATNCFGMRQDNAREASVEVRSKYEGLARVDCKQDATVLGFVGMPLDVVNKAMRASIRLPWDSFLHENRRRDPTRYTPECFHTCFDRRNWDWITALRTLSPESGESSCDEISSRTRALNWLDPTARWHFEITLQELHELFNRVYSLSWSNQRKLLQYPTGVNETKFASLLQGLADFLCHYDNKYIFQTTSGRVGFSPKPTSSGDKVIYVPGGRSLHIISGDESRYVGIAYVEDFVDNGLLNLPTDEKDKRKMYMSRNGC
jgi:hypothetical protein